MDPEGLTQWRLSLTDVFFFLGSMPCDTMISTTTTTTNMRMSMGVRGGMGSMGHGDIMYIEQIDRAWHIGIASTPAFTLICFLFSISRTNYPRQ
ncbi:hypothetical protein BP00DRAFT_109625 [Aspergillus indologenus CBS 114.80]|uniref:Uncharacterized protein n=1 Tax=Aspergillus indologenus CBS 114.80 TaxID=1450541 RepID=A0A2V5IK86_9EURO|nr:hypothetical protein BP00DRAFT_109625 [Aspergillus indologenus CBS 114.80]